MKATGRWLCVLVLLLSFAPPLCAQPYGGPDETDVLVVRNGDSLTGELLGLQRGQAALKTDAASTIYVKWPRVLTVTSSKQFEIHLDDGSKYFGSLSAGDTTRTVVIRSAQDTLMVPTQSIVQLTRLGRNFWSRFNGSVSVGFSFTQQDSKVDLSSGLQLAYIVELHRLTLRANGSYSRQDSASTISSQDIALGWNREFSHMWLWNVTAQMQQNSQLSLDLSLSIGTGPGRIFVSTNHVWLASSIGPFFRTENYADEDPRIAIPLSLSTDFELFSWAGLSTDLSSHLAVAPVLNDPGRWQINFSAQLSRDLISNLTLNLTVTEYYDSNPPADANRNAFTVDTSISWTFGSGLY